MTARRPSRSTIPRAPEEYSRRWAADLVRSLENTLNLLEAGWIPGITLDVGTGEFILQDTDGVDWIVSVDTSGNLQTTAK